MIPKYPDISVRLTGINGNALNIIGQVRKALRKNNVASSEIVEFCVEATSGDYDNVLITCMKWVDCE